MSDDDREYHVSPPPMGGNYPPPDDLHVSAIGEVRAYFDFHAAALTGRRDELLAAAMRDIAAYDATGVPDDETQGALAENRRMIETLARTAKERHDTDKLPFLAASRAIDEWFRSLMQPLEAPLAVYRRLMDAYVQKKVIAARAHALEQAREAEDEAERLRLEVARQIEQGAPNELTQAALADAKKATDESLRAALAAVATKPAEQSRVHGDFGALASARRRWRWRVVKESDIPRKFLSPDKDKINGWMGAGGKNEDGSPKNTIKGVEIYEDITSGVR